MHIIVPVLFLDRIFNIIVVNHYLLQRLYSYRDYLRGIYKYGTTYINHEAQQCSVSDCMDNIPKD